MHQMILSSGRVNLFTNDVTISAFVDELKSHRISFLQLHIRAMVQCDFTNALPPIEIMSKPDAFAGRAYNADETSILRL